MNGESIMRGHPTMGGDRGPFGGAGGTALGPSVLPNTNQLVAAWFIAPITGADNRAGTSPATAIKTMAEWRRRIWGARYGSLGFPTVVTINVLESSSSLDDGLMFGYTTVGLGMVVILGTPVQIGVNSTLTAVAQYAGNARATVSDASLPVSWTASYGVTGVGGSRYIRRVGAAAQALILPSEVVAKTIMIGLSTDTSETSTASPTVGAAPFAVNDIYQVVQRISWPRLVTFGNKARLQCCDVVGIPAIAEYEPGNLYVLCGFLSAISWAGNISCFNCGFASTVVSGRGDFVPLSCSFLDVIQLNGAPNWNGQNNVFLNAQITTNHQGSLSGTGTLRAFDCVTPFLNLSRGARADISAGAIVGSGNTSKIASVTSGSFITDAGLITATTSDALPYQVAGVSYAAPTVDNSKGCGIFV